MIKSFNFFRIWGALAIFICHITMGTIGGSVPLDLFFVLSGFGIYWGYADKVSEGKLTLRAFMKKRIKKVYFAYFIMTLVGWIYMTQICDYDIIRTTIKLPGHLLFLQPWVSGYSTAFNGAAWYVASLMWLYLFFYFLQQVGQKKANCFFIIYCLLYLSATTLWQREIESSVFDLGHNPLTCFLYFYLGVKTADFYKKYPLKCSESVFTVLECVLLIVMVFMTFLIEGSTPIANVVICLFFCLLYYVFAHEKGVVSKFFTKKVFSVLSSYTYYFYMIHYMVIMYTVHLFDLSEISFGQAMLLFVITSVLSFALKKIEKVMMVRKIANYQIL